MIRLRGFPLSDTEAAELAQRLRAQGDSEGHEVAERLERALAIGGGTIGTSSRQARAVLGVLVNWDEAQRLREVRESLRQFIAGAPVVSSIPICSDCHRSPHPGENLDDEWRAFSDGLGGLDVFCPECAQREFGAPSGQRVRIDSSGA